MAVFRDRHTDLHVGGLAVLHEESTAVLAPCVLVNEQQQTVECGSVSHVKLSERPVFEEEESQPTWSPIVSDA